MSALQRFVAYAAAFEQAYASDDWSLVEPFFTEDAVYDAGLPGLLAGRIEGRSQDGDAISVKARGVYTAEGAPDLAFELEETAHFSGDRMRFLEDVYGPEAKERFAAYLREHGARLGLGLREAR